MKITLASFQVLYLSLLLVKESECIRNTHRKKHYFDARILRSIEEIYNGSHKEDPQDKAAPTVDFNEAAHLPDSKDKLPKEDPKSKAPKEDSKKKSPKKNPKSKATKEDPKKKSPKKGPKSKAPKEDPKKKSPKKDLKKKSKKALSKNKTILKESCLSTVSSIRNVSTNDTATANVTDIEGEIKYKYSLESITTVSNETEQILKEAMFQGLAGHICKTRRRLSSFSHNEVLFVRYSSSGSYHHRRLEVVELESSLRDANIGSCVPKLKSNNTCTKYQGEIEVSINNVGENDDMKETSANVISYLEDFAKTTNWSTISDNILGMTVALQRGADTPAEAQKGSGVSKGTIAGMVAGIGALAAVLFGVLYMKRSKENVAEVNLVEIDSEKEEGGKDKTQAYANPPSEVPPSDDPYDNIPVAVATPVP